MSSRAELKDRLREAIESNNKKAADLAKDLNIPKSAISQYLSGDRTIKDSKRIYAIARYLNVSEAWLMGYDVPMERPIEQKNNDILSDIIVRMRNDKNFSSIIARMHTDEEFFSLIKMLHGLEPDQVKGVSQMLTTFLK